MKKLLNGIYNKHCGQSLDKIEKDTDRDNFMTAEQAKEWGLIDEIITRRQDP
jgi:ATP-dependent Clp protease protease subunit